MKMGNNVPNKVIMCIYELESLLKDSERGYAIRQYRIKDVIVKLIYWKTDFKVVQ